MPLWEGIRNRQAVRKGYSEYSITVEWHEGKKHIEASRSWPLPLSTYAGELDIRIDGKPIAEEEANIFLENSLPSELVPFFHFDGELIRDLAEAREGRLMTYQIERLLDLRRIIALEEQCKIVLKDFRKQYASDEHIQKELELDSKKSGILADRMKSEKQRADLNSNLQEIEIRTAKIDRELNSLFRAGSLHDEDALIKQKQDANERLEDSCERFIDCATFDLPLCVNPDLSRRVINRLAEMQRDESTEQKYLLEKLKRVLPEELFGLPPYSNPRLTASQEKFFVDKLRKMFKKMTNGLNNKTQWRIGLDRLSELYEEFTLAYSTAKNRQSRAAEILRQIRREKEKLDQIEEKLIEAGGLSRRARERYEQLKIERANLDQAKGSKLQQIKDVSGEMKRLDEKLVNLDKKLEKVRGEIEKASRGQRKVDLLADSIKALDNYRDLMRDQYREDIQKLVNDHFFQILDSFDLIGSIKLNNDFIPEYYDTAGQSIGRLSISAGTKQLLATAFLWALKEVSERKVPVVVDTPLARIDRRHQENLLKRFYPCVSEQVIILPTDSELDINKYSLLKDHIFREYKLENPTGIRTKVTPTQMYKID